MVYLCKIILIIVKIKSIILILKTNNYNKNIEILTIFGQKCLRWFGHIQWSESWILVGSAPYMWEVPAPKEGHVRAGRRSCKSTSLHVGGSSTQGRPRKSWQEVLQEYLPTCGRFQDSRKAT